MNIFHKLKMPSLSPLSKTAITLISLAALMSGCNDDLLDEPSMDSDKMVFSVDSNNLWSARSGAPETLPDGVQLVKTIPVYDPTSRDTLYVHVIMEDGIDVKHQEQSAHSRNSEFTENAFFADIALYKSDWSEETRVDYIQDQKFVKTSAGYESSPACFWPASDQYKTRIFAHWPQKNENLQISVGNGTPVIDFTVPENSKDAIDLLVATTEVKGKPSVAPTLTFEHALAGVKFGVAANEKNMKCNVSTIRLDGIYGRGKYIVSDTNIASANNSISNNLDKRVWTTDGVAPNFGIDFTPEVGDADITPKIAKTFDGNPLLLVPQTFADGATLTINMVDYANEPRTLTADISGIMLEQGKTIKFIVGTTKVVFYPVITVQYGYRIGSNHTGIINYKNTMQECLEGMQSLKYTGITNQNITKNGLEYPIYLRISSYAYTMYASSDDNADGNENSFMSKRVVPMDIKCDFLVKDFDSDEFTDKINHPSASVNVKKVRGETIYDENKQAIGSKYIYEGEIFVGQQVNVGKRNSASLQIYNNPPVGSETDPVNLAGAKGSETTANCYLINAPGYYTFPAVFGNALLNGQDNVSAYTYNGTNNNYNFYLNVFQSGARTSSKILSPDIKSHLQAEGINLANVKAKLLWQDSGGMISNVHYDESTNYISFQVNKEAIRQGNAVIAIYDNTYTNTPATVWSWHIWLTPLDLNSDYFTWENTSASKRLSMLSQNIGWCDPEDIYYRSYDFKLRATQYYCDDVEVGTKYIGDSFHQEGENVYHTPQFGNCPRFQWGRKDPMIPYINEDGSSVITDDTDDKWKFKGIFLNLTDAEINTVEKNKYMQISPGNPNLPMLMRYPYYHYMYNGEYAGIKGCIYLSKHLNFWGCHNGVNDTHVKTIYDPSPVGYVVPAYEDLSFPSNGRSLTYNENTHAIDMAYNGATVLSFPYVPTKRLDYVNWKHQIKQNNSLATEIMSLWVRDFTASPYYSAYWHTYVFKADNSAGIYRVVGNNTDDPDGHNGFRSIAMPVRPVKDYLTPSNL